MRDRLLRRISATGPMTLQDYMQECLLHPTEGYYTTGTVFGVAGDFTTAPEISQMFGELIGLAFAQVWRDQGCPAGAILAELGPGRGTMMADFLRATRRVPGFRAAMNLHLVEASPALRERQRTTLACEDVTWIDQLKDLPGGPLFLAANEFLDAYPIRQFRRDGPGWRERMITARDGTLAFAWGPAHRYSQLDQRLRDTADGDIVEIRPGLPALVGEIAQRIATGSGLAMLIDYGGWHSRGDTFQALHAHRPVDPLADPGKADLTAHVDFEAVAEAAHTAGAAVTPMVPQGVLLERLGIAARAQSLAHGLTSETALQSHVAAHRGLTHPEEMGSLFKAIAIHPPGTPPPPGFLP